jgi:hypothetical protein
MIKIYRYGSSWLNSLVFARASHRGDFSPRNRNRYLGFRIILINQTYQRGQIRNHGM